MNQRNSEWTDLMVSRLQRLSHEGYSGGHIAKRVNEEFGRSFTRSAVIGKLHRMGCTVGGKTQEPRGSGWTDEMVDTLKQAYADGHLPQVVAQKVSAVAKREVSVRSIFAKAGSMGMVFKRVSRAVFADRFIRREPAPIEARLPRIPAKRIPLAPDVEPLACDPVSMADLGPSHCRFIVSRVDGLNTLYCGDRSVRWSYCAKHAKVVFLPPPERKAKAPVGRETPAVRRFA